MPLATKVDRTPSVPLAMIVALFTNVRGIACFQIFTPRNLALGARKSAAKELMGTLKPHCNGPQYRHGTLAVRGWAVTFDTTGRGLGGCGPAQSLHHCTKCNSPPINGKYINFILLDVALLPVPIKGLKLAEIKSNKIVALQKEAGPHYARLWRR